MSEPTRALIQAHCNLASARNWPQFVQLLHPALLYEAPQTREYIEGSPGYLDIFNTWPGDWTVTVMQLICQESEAISIINFAVGKEVMTGISVFELNKGLIAKGNADLCGLTAMRDRRVGGSITP